MFDLPVFTFVHVLISVVGIIAGLIAVGALVTGVVLRGWTGTFLLTTLVTAVTGFGFPFTKVLPPHIVGVLTILVLLVALYALYVKHLQGGWRKAYAVGAVAALYFNVFVLVVQLITKTPPIAQLGATPQDPPFAIAQALVLAIFVYIGWKAVKKA